MNVAGSWWDWNVMSEITMRHERVGYGFPLELAADLILSPHMFGWREDKRWAASRKGQPRARKSNYTNDHTPSFILYVVRYDEHARFLREEVEPLLPVETALVIVDPRTQTFSASGGAMESFARLPAFLDDRVDLAGAIAPDAFAKLTARPPIGEAVGAAERVDGTLASRLEQAPLRLWEVLLARGFHRRWELVRGEVPLLADLPSALAANRSFLQCIHDAEAWTDTTAVESAGFIEVGPFRLRQRGTLLEIRAKLTPADIRVGFMPTCELPGSEDLPTLAGVLTAGGDNGKTEWIHGYTWSTADCEIDGETARLASAVAATLEKVGVTRVDTADREAELPKATDGRWEIHHDERFLTVYTPLYRDDCAPVDAVL